VTGQLASRFRHLSPLPYTTGALGPLLPGSLLYTGVLGLVHGDTAKGLGDLTRAGATALALALGVNLSGELARLAHPEMRHALRRRVTGLRARPR
jgi:uncharacterized membrane protein YjjB (DUF3815 family)